MRQHQSVSWAVAICVCIALIPLVPARSAAATDQEPVLRLFSTKSEATAVRYGSRAARLEPALFVAVAEGALDLRVRRESFAEPLTLTQVVHGAAATERVLPADLLDSWRGLDNFFRVKVTDPAGRVAWTELLTWCPNSYGRQRIDDSGPDVPTFPHGCYASPRLLGMAWGVDRGWAVPSSNRGLKLPVPDGDYSVHVEITPGYRDLFGIAAEDASAELAVTVETVEDECRECSHPFRRESSAPSQTEQGVPDMADPPDSVLPDLRTLPAFGMHVRNRRNGRSYLEFAATVWVSGAAPVVVEGFRRSGESVMDAYQYFYEDGEPVGRAPAGTFDYDERDQHHHWHILQFVRYQLIDADQTNAVRSAKESFCLVPTDAVDLSGDNAERTEERADLHTSCGGEGALWIRETLPLGWGDTYYQGGRYGFEITDLPNGTYFVEVAANPDGLLYEQEAGNNASLREVVLRGARGRRRVVVPDPYGIDGGRR